MKNSLKMLLGCGLAMLLIFILPALEVSNGVTIGIAIVLMLGCHLFMGHGYHQKEHDKRHDKHH